VTVDLDGEIGLAANLIAIHLGYDVARDRPACAAGEPGSTASTAAPSV
jgi:hypothetical protein